MRFFLCVGLNILSTSSFKFSSREISRHHVQQFSTSIKAVCCSKQANREDLGLQSTVLPSDDHFMQLALRQAQHCFMEMEIPVGAVIVGENASILLLFDILLFSSIQIATVSF